MNIVEREREALRGTGDPTPPRVGCTGPLNLQELSFRILIKFLISQVKIPSYLLQFVGSQNFIVSRSRLSSCPEERYYSSGQLGESLDLMNIVERERESSWRLGPVTLPPRVGCTGPLNLQELSFRILINFDFHKQIGGRRPPSYLLQFVGSQNFIVSRSRLSAARKRGTTLPGNLERASI